MPIEIKELHIKTVVDNSSNNQRGGAPVDQETVKKIVAQCVEQVMDIMHQKSER